VCNAETDRIFSCALNNEQLAKIATHRTAPGK
jgi:hypothetical protein